MGDDTIYGNAGDGTAPGSDSSPIDLSLINLVSDSSSGNGNAQAIDIAVYYNFFELADGTSISVRLILTGTTNPSLNIDMSGGNGAEILVNSGQGGVGAGEQALFIMEFFNSDTGATVSLN